MNPIVTVAFALRHDFHWRRVPGYILAQLLGALLLRATFSDVAPSGPPCRDRHRHLYPPRTWTVFIATAARQYTRRATITLAKTLLDHVKR